MARVVLLGLLVASLLAASCIADRKAKDKEGTSPGNNVGVVREHLTKDQYDALWATTIKETVLQLSKERMERNRQDELRADEAQKALVDKEKKPGMLSRMKEAGAWIKSKLGFGKKASVVKTASLAQEDSEQTNETEEGAQAAESAQAPKEPVQVAATLLEAKATESMESDAVSSAVSVGAVASPSAETTASSPLGDKLRPPPIIQRPPPVITWDQLRLYKSQGECANAKESRRVQMFIVNNQSNRLELLLSFQACANEVSADSACGTDHKIFRTRPAEKPDDFRVYCDCMDLQPSEKCELGSGSTAGQYIYSTHSALVTNQQKPPEKTSFPLLRNRKSGEFAGEGEVLDRGRHLFENFKNAAASE